MSEEPVIETIGIIGGLVVYIIAMAQHSVFGGLIQDALSAF